MDWNSFSRTVRAKETISSTSSSGTSIAAKCPPRGISLQWVTSFRIRQWLDYLAEFSEGSGPATRQQ